MMKLNKKGFTLVELLAVVVILLAISVIAVSSISAAIERNKVKQNEAKEKLIVSYAKLYYDEHKNSLGDSGCITIKNLIDSGYISEDEVNDADGDPLIKNFKVDGVEYSNNGKIFEFGC